MASWPMRLPQLSGHHGVLHRDVEKASIWSVCLAVGRQALGDADARAVELSHDPLVNGAKRATKCRDTTGLGLLVDDASASVLQPICTPQLLDQSPTLMRLALHTYRLPKKSSVDAVGHIAYG